MSSIVFTVFTPTYNRGHTLSRVYKSLKRQTFTDFEWLIIDDGSTDDTCLLVNQWIRERSMNIRYVYQERGHKKKAHNRAVHEARGAFLLVLDSDDELFPDALDIFHSAWLGIPESIRDRFFGVCGLCIDSKGQVVGDCFPRDVLYSNSLEMFYRYGVRGEKAGCGRVDILREYLFPEDIAGYVPENVVWHRIAERYQTVFVNQIVRIYHDDVVSITRPRHRLENIRASSDGHTYLARETLERELVYFLYRPVWFLKMAANYTRFHLHLRYIQPTKHYALRQRNARWLVSLMKPVGWLLYVIDNLRG